MSYPTSLDEAKKYTYNFWKNKPVKKFDDISVNSERIENKLAERLVYSSDEPITLPSSMIWEDVMLDDITRLSNICDFLNKNYDIESKDRFRTLFTPEYIQWKLRDGLILTIKSKDSDKIYGVIGCYFRNMVVYDKSEIFGIPDLLCAIPLFRKKKIAYTLIDEMVRRIIKLGYLQGCFVTKKCVPTPITTIRQYHRPLNYMKLKECNFIDIEGDNVKINKFLQISEDVSTNYVEMTTVHLTDVLKLYNKFTFRFNIHYEYTVDELKKLLLDNNIVKSYVIMKDDAVVDFVSYYKLPFHVTDSDQIINCAYLYLYSSENVNTSNMIKELLKILNKEDIDVLTIYDTGNMYDALLLKDSGNCESDYESYVKSYQHNFTKGTGKTYFNFFNWTCPSLATNQLYFCM
jgi:glycylpeptide N-tetradecanoyltransferase